MCVNAVNEYVVSRLPETKPALNTDRLQVALAGSFRPPVGFTLYT